MLLVMRLRIDHITALIMSHLTLLPQTDQIWISALNLNLEHYY